MHTHSKIERERYGFRSVRLLVWRCVVIVTQLPRCQLILLFLLFTLAHTRLCHTTVKSSWIEREAQTYRYIAHHRRIIVCACWMCRNTRNKKQETSSSSNRRSIQCIRNVLRERAPVSNVWWIEWVPLCCDSVEQYTLNGAFGSLLVCACVCLCKTLLSLSQSVPLFVAAELLCACYTLNAIRWLLLLLLLLLLANSSSSFRLRAVWFSLSYVAVSIQQHHIRSCYLLFKQYVRSLELYDNMILS